MKRVLGLVVMLGVLSMLVAPAFARVAMIETSVALADESQTAVDAAITEAVDSVMRAALAMGLSHVQLMRAAIVEHVLVIGIVATDTPSTGDADGPESPEESAPATPDTSRRIEI
jgi:hypothetical protein